MVSTAEMVNTVIALILTNRKVTILRSFVIRFPRTVEIICHFCWEQLPHPPYDPGLTLSVKFCIEQCIQMMK